MIIFWGQFVPLTKKNYLFAVLLINHLLCRYMPSLFSGQNRVTGCPIYEFFVHSFIVFDVGSTLDVKYK